MDERNTEDADRALPILLTAFYAAWAVLIAASALHDASAPSYQDRIYLLDLDSERSFYTWVSQLWLAVIAFVLLDIGVNARTRSPLVRGYWLVFALGFAFLSMDEGLSFHETLGRLVPDEVSATRALGLWWVLPAALASLFVGLASIPFIRRLPRPVAVMFVVSGAIYLLGAIGLETVAGQLMLMGAEDKYGLAFRAEVTIEEGLEGLGALLFLATLIRNRAKLVRPGVAEQATLGARPIRSA